MAGAVQVGALVINMAADVAALKTNLADATRSAQTAGQQIVGHLSAVRTGVESAIQPLQNLTVKFGSLESQIKNAQQSVLSLAKGLIIGSAAGLSIDAIKHKIDGVIDSMAHLKEVSEKTGASVESLSKLSYYAKQGGSDIDSVASSLTRLARSMAGADDESKGAGQALAFLGLTAKDAAGNLKDPAELFIDIAKRLDTYRDGAGKAAIAQALFGKSGADMLPTMKEIAEQGDVVAKVTTAQARAADQYTKDLGRLEAQKGALFKTIASALLPAMTDFTNALLDASTKTDNLGKKAKDLNADGAMTEWADSAAMGAARLVDVIVMLPKLLASVGSSFKVVGMDVAVFGTAVAEMNPAYMAKQLAKGQNPFAGLKTILAERNEVLAQATQRYSDLWNADGAAMEKAMAKRIAARKAAAAATKAADAERDRADAAKPNLNFSTSSGDEAKEKEKEASAYATLSAAIRAKTTENQVELAITGQLTDSQKMTAKLDAELEAKKISLTTAHEAEVRAKLADLAVTEDLLAAQAAQRDVTRYIAESTRAREDQSAALDVEYAMYGKTADARAIAMVAVQAEAWQEAELAKLRADNKPISDQIITQLNAERDARIEVGQAVLGQTKGLQYAGQLADENKRFAAESIVDERARAYALLQIDADAWQERIRLAGDGTEAQKRLQEQYAIWYQNQLLKPQMDEQRRIWQSIEQTAHDTFISIFDSGKSAFDRLRDTLKNGLLDLLYQMTLKPWILQIGAAVGIGSVGSAAQAATGASGGGLVSTGSGLINAASTAGSLYKVAGAGIMNTIGGGIATLGNFAGSSSLSAFGAGFAGNTAASGYGSVAEGFSSMGMTSEAGAASMGASAASAAGILGGIAGGVYGGRAISGGYGSNGAVNTGTAIGAAVGSIVPVIGTAIGALVGGLLGGAYNRLFGHKAPEVESQGIRGTFSGDALSGDSYQNILEKGGLFASDKRYTNAQALSGDLLKQLTQGFTTLESVSLGFATSLGVSAGALKDYSKAFDIVTTGDAAKDQQAITAFFTGISDEIANKLVPDLERFTKSGETASAALQRLAGDFTATNQVAQLLGKSAVDVFGSLGMESAAARERVIDLSGGVSALSQQAQFYSQNFLTDAQRLVPVQKALDAAMASLGLSSVQTRAQLKGVVDSLDLTKEADAQEFASIMKLTEAFALVHPAIDATTTALDAQATAQKALKDGAVTLLGGVDAAYSVLQSVVGREKAVLQTRIDTETAAVTKLQSLSQALHGALDAMKGPDQAAYDRLAAQGQIKAALAIARAGGPLPEADSLKGALSALSQDSSGMFATYADYLKDFYSTKNDIADLAGVTDDSLSVEQKALAALNAQVKQLDGVLSDAQSQIDVLKGQSTTLLSIEDALQALTAAMLSAQGNPVVAATSAVNKAYQGALGRAPDAAGLQYWQDQAAAGVPVSDIVGAITNSPEATVRGLYQTMLGRPPDAAGLNFWMAQLGQGVSLMSVRDALAGSSEAKHHAGVPGFAAGGDFGGGWRLVGERGMELEATGPARIFNANQTSSILSRLASPSENSQAVLQELKAMRAELAQLKHANSAENVAAVKQQQATNDILTRVVYGGDALQTKAVS